MNKKKNLLPKRILSAMLCLVLMFTGFPIDASAEGTTGQNTATSTEDVVWEIPFVEIPGTPDDMPDNDELFAAYAEQNIFGMGGMATTFAFNRSAGLLGEVDRNVYTVLASQLVSIAENGGSTQFVLDVSGMGVKYTVDAINNDEITGSFNVNVPKILDALREDYPYELYWYDKTQNMSYGTNDSFSGSLTAGSVVDLTTLTFKFPVASAYQDTNATDPAYTVSTSGVTAAKTAKANADSVITEASKKANVYDKLLYCLDYIKENVEYGDPNSMDKNTWQMIWAFDGNPSTNVVCEGYAKAFKYLCDGIGVECYTVSGTMSGGTGAGPHMWNIVVIDNKSYLVDPTNCDSGTIGSPYKLFLKAPDSQTAETSYTYDFGGVNTVEYVYDSDTTDLFGGTGILTLDTVDYTAPVIYTVTIATGITNGTVTATPTSAQAGETITLTVTPENGYVLDALTVTAENATAPTPVETNGKYTFTMPASNVTVNATFIPCNHNGNNSSDYSASGNVITATCSVCGDIAGTATITAQDGTYDGTLHEANVTKTSTLENVNVTVMYYKGNELLDTAPINAGTYTAKMTYGEVTASIEYTIGKATPTISVGVSSGNLSPGASVVIGTSAKNPNNEELTDTPSVTCTYQIGDGEVSAFTNGFSIPKGTAVGTVITITASTAEDANYAAATKTITVTVEACNHTGGTQTCKGYQCANCGEWYGQEGTHVPDMYGKCTIEGCDKQYEAKIGNYGDTDISCFYDKITDAFNAGGNLAILHVLADVILTEDAVIGGFYRMYMNGHTITLNDGSTLTFLGVHLHGEGRIIGDVEGPLVINNNGGTDWLSININNSHANGYAMQVNQSVYGGLVLNGSKADILLPSEEARVGIDIYEENQIIRIAYAEGVDPIGAWLWVPKGGSYERSVWKHYELVSPQGYVLVEEYDEMTGYATGIRVKKPITADMVTISPDAGSYGETHSPTIVVIYKNETLVQDRDYTVEAPANMSDAGSYTYTITGIGNRFAGEAEVEYTVNKVNISGANISLDLNETLYYNGGAITPAVGSVVLNNTTLVKDTDYTVSYTNNTNVGTATVTITGKGNYTGTASTTFTINKATPVVTVPTAKDLTYSGQAQTLVNAGSTTGGTIQYSTLENGTYSTNIPEATDVGTYTVWYKVVGGSNYQDIEAQSIAIEIMPREVTAPVFADMEEAYSYTGNAVEPTFTLKDGDTVIPTTEYEVRYQYNVNVGIASIVVTDRIGGNYTVSGTKSFTINKAQPDVYVVPTVTERTYHPSQALENSDLSGGIAIGVDGSALEGSWSFATAGIVPKAGSNSYEVIFTPIDANYTEVTTMVVVTVDKAVATVEELPIASAIAYGDTLETSTFSGGKMVCGNVVVPGTYEWMFNGVTPTVADSNSTTYSVMFVPEDTTNYEYVEMKVSLTVNKADPVVQIPRVMAEYGQTLKDNSLPQGWEWEEESTSVGNAGIHSFNAIYTPEDTANYNVITREITVDVMRAGLLIVSVQTSDRAYDGTKNVQVTGATLTGILGSDEVYVQIPAGGLTGVLESADAGTYTKVQLPLFALAGADAGNYTIAEAEYNTTNVTISKAPSYTVADINKSYIYTEGSEGKVDLDIAKLLKNDMGNCTYVLDVADTEFVDSASVSTDGILSYEIIGTGNIGDKVTMVVTATSQNYEDVKVKVIITLTDKIAVEEKADAKVSVAGNLVYGQKLSELAFANTSVIVEAGTSKEVKGSLKWDDEADRIFNAGTHQVNWRFVPEDSTRYKELTGTLTITVERSSITAQKVQPTLDAISVPDVKEELPWTVGLAIDIPYSVKISWTPNDTEATFNTVYAANVTFTADANHLFEQGITLEGWEVVSNSGAVLVAKRTFNATRKAELVGITLPKAVTLTKYYDKAQDAIAELPTTVMVEVEGSENAIAMPITWKCEAYVTSPNAVNIFVWTIKPEAYATYDAGNVDVSGRVAITNSAELPAATPTPTVTDPGKPFIQDETGKIGWVVIEDELEKATAGETVHVNMNGATVVPGYIFDEIKGQDITITLLMDNGISWTVYGKDVTAKGAKDIDLAVTVATESKPVNNIPVNVLNKVIGEKYHVNISLKHNGELGMKAILNINLDAKNKGLFANLFYYNAARNSMQFVWADDIDENGMAHLVFDHASEYSIVIDKEIMQKSATAVQTGDDSVSPVLLVVIMLVSLLVAGGIILYLYKGKRRDRRE